MIRCTEHTRHVRNPKIKCRACSMVLEPGERYRQLVFVNEDLFSPFERWVAHVGCVWGREEWELRRPEPEWSPPALPFGMTQEEQDLLLHTLGIGTHIDRSRHGYRNHYCALDGDERCERLVSQGLLERGGTINNGRNRYYRATCAGGAAVGRPDLGVRTKTPSPKPAGDFWVDLAAAWEAA